MATNIEQILGRDINSLKELREEIKRLQDSIANVDPATEEFKDTTEKLVAAQEQLTAVTRAGKDGMDVAKDSIVGMEREYRNLYNTYKLLSEEQRNSDMGRQMAESLNELSNKLNETKKGVGNFKDNIGRYAESAIEAFSKMGGSVGGLVGPFANATKGVMGFSAALKANPVGAVITLIMGLVNAVKALTGSIKGNEESQMRLNQAMASFQPIIDAASNAMDKMGKAIVSVIEFIANLVDKIRLAKAAFTDFIGITKGAKKEMEEQQKTYKDLAASVNNLTLKKREYQKLNAADEAEVQRLREEASETANLEEKKKLLTEAKEIQAGIDQRNIEIAKEELRILEVQASLTANDAAMNDKLAAAVAKVSQAEATAAQNMRQFNKQLSAGTQSLNTHVSATKSAREEAKKLYEDLIEQSKDEVTKLTEKYQKEKKLLEKYHLDTTLLTKKYNKDIADYNKKMAKDFADAMKSASEAASKKWLESVQYSMNHVGQILKTENAHIGTELLDEWNEWEAKSKAYNDLYRNILGIDTTMPEAKDMLSDFIGDINNLLGTDLKIPPTMDEENLQKLRKQLAQLKGEISDAARYAFGAWMISPYEDRIRMGTETLMAMRIDALKSGGKEVIETLNSLDYQELQLQAENYEQMLKMDGLTYDKRMEIMQNYYAVLDEMRARNEELDLLSAERTQAIWDNAFENYDSVSNSINTVIGSVNSLIQAQINDSKTTEAEAKKKKKTLIALEKVALAVNVAQIAASTAAGIMDVWKSYGAELALNAQTAAATGPAAAATKAALDAKSLASAIIRTATLGTTGAANIAAATMGTIAKVKAMNDEGGSSAAAGTAAQPQEIDSTPYTYTRTLQTAEEEDMLNRPIYVSVTDINEVQNRVQVRDNESSF